MIEIYLLEQLNTFVSCGTLSEAAEKLHMTQPTLSRSMRKLEDYFGFPLFNRDKKRLSLNESGKLMAEYARKILDEELEMEKHVRNFHKSLQTLHIGSIAPGPLMVILPQGAAFYPDITITSTVDTEEAILRGLLSDEYGIAILTHPIEDEHFISKKYISEHLNLSVSAIHPAASKNSVSFAEMNGQNFLMFSQVGIWEDLVKTQMPDSSFYKQESFKALAELTKFSELPSFSTNISLAHSANERISFVNIPFSDASATITYYLIYKQKNETRWRKILDSQSFCVPDTL